MIVGMVDLKTGKSPKFSRFKVWLYNTIERILDSRYRRKGVVLECINCGDMLDPRIENFGPRSCGWHKTKRGWICHWCYDPNSENLCCNLTEPHMQDFLETVK